MYLFFSNVVDNSLRYHYTVFRIDAVLLEESS